MAKLRGNIFVTDNNEFDNEILNNRDQINHQQKTITEVALELEKSFIFKTDPVQEIELTYNNFKDYHYKLLGGKFISLSPTPTGFKYITYDGYCFICSDKRLIELISNTPKPLKISFLYADKNTMPISLVCKILYNQNISSLKELVSFFSNKPIDFTEENCYQALIHIYKKLFNLINDYSMVNYFNLERDIYLIYYKYNTSIDINHINKVINSKSNELSTLLSHIDNSIKMTPNKNELLKYLELDTDLPISLHPDIGDKNFIKTYELTKQISCLKALKENLPVLNNLSRIGFICYDTAFNYLLSSPDKVTIKATLVSTYFNYLLKILRLNKYLIDGDSDIYLVNYIHSISEDIDNTLVNTLLLVIEGLINNFTDPIEIQKYLLDCKDTLLSIEDINIFLDFLRDNLGELYTRIHDYNNKNHIDDDYKFISHNIKSPLNNRITYMISLDMKKIILTTQLTIDHFNNSNTKNIFISDITQDSIFINCDNDISNIAIDILNRTVIDSLGKLTTSASPTVYIDILPND